jgi:hypothetical protein
MHHLQLRDVFMMSWFTFIPLALCFFLYHHTVDSADFEFGGSFIMLRTFYFFYYYAVYVNYGLFSFVSLIL